MSPGAVAALSSPAVDLAGIPLWQRRNWSSDVSTAPNLLGELAGDEDASVRAGVAANEWAPPDVLRSLATDPADAVRVEVAANRRTPPDVLGELAGDTTPIVRSRAAANPSTPPTSPG